MGNLAIFKEQQMDLNKTFARGLNNISVFRSPDKLPAFFSFYQAENFSVTEFILQELNIIDAQNGEVTVDFETNLDIADLLIKNKNGFYQIYYFGEDFFTYDKLYRFKIIGNYNYYSQPFFIYKYSVEIPSYQIVFTTLGFLAGTSPLETIDKKGLSNLEILKSNIPYMILGITGVSAIGLDKNNFIFSTYFIRQGGNSDGFGTLFSQGGTNGIEMSYAVYLYDNGQITYFQKNGIGFNITYGATFTIGVKYHFVIYKNGTEIKAYINGNLVGTFTGPISATNIFDTNNPFRIGRGRTALERYYNGSIFKTQFAEYSTTDLAAAISDTVMPNALFYLPAAEGNGDKLYDITNNAKHFSITGAILTNYWSKKQNYFYNNLIYGFQLYESNSTPGLYIRVPYKIDGTKLSQIIANYTFVADYDGGTGWNFTENTVRQKSNSTLIAADTNLFWYDSLCVPKDKTYAEVLANTEPYIQFTNNNGIINDLRFKII
jgi:hypothetical protein